MSEKVMHFKVKAGKMTYEGDLTVPDDDGTSTLPMMTHSLIKELTEERPEIHEITSMIVETKLVPKVINPTEGA